MKRLWLFNPDNDIALAHGGAHFTAPAAAMSLRKAGQLLPLWIGNEGDAVLCDGVNDKWLSQIQNDFNIKVEPWNHTPNFAPTPWGWSRSVRNDFAMVGVHSTDLPSDEHLDHIRLLSHRRTSAIVANILANRLSFNIWPAATEITDRELLAATIAEGNKVIKAPWSSSGRGILFVTPTNHEIIQRQAEGIIRRQGSVMVEIAAHKRLDFAMLFNYTYDRCSFEGFSLFQTDSLGNYEGNIVASQEIIIERIAKYVPIQQLYTLINTLPSVLSEVLEQNYNGPVGIDMIATETALHAVVEINLRYTMGFVALNLAKIIDGEGIFRILKGDHSSYCKYQASNGKLNNGTIALTPAGGDFTFILCHL